MAAISAARSLAALSLPRRTASSVCGIVRFDDVWITLLIFTDDLFDREMCEEVSLLCDRPAASRVYD